MLTATTNTLEQLLGADLVKALRTHLQLFLEADPREIYARNFTRQAEGIYSLTLAGIPFLNTQAPVDAWLVQQGGQTMFCLVPRPPDSLLSTHFPKMVPPNALNYPTVKPSFPNIAGQKLKGFKWLYVFAPGSDEGAKKALWQVLYEKIKTTFQDLLPASREMERLQTLSGWTAWRGGL